MYSCDVCKDPMLRSVREPRKCRLRRLVEDMEHTARIFSEKEQSKDALPFGLVKLREYYLERDENTSNPSPQHRPMLSDYYK